MKTDVLFINPGNQKKTYQELDREFTAIAPPVWTVLLADHVRRQGYTTAVYDVNVEGWQEDTAEALLRRYAPVFIVMMVYGHQPSASTQTMPAAGRIARDIKKAAKDVPIVMGGTHPSALPERTLTEEAIDFLMQGEGVYTLDGLARYLKGNGKIQDIKGLWHRKSGTASFTSPAPLVKDLDEELPEYAWDLLPDLSRYRAHNMHCFQDFQKSARDDFSDVRSPYAVIYTSLGCPYDCHYCCINATYAGPGIRYWSVEKVVSWIDILAGRHGVKNIRFDDELFILSPERVERFCDLLIERGHDLNLWVYGRVDTVDKRLLEKLKKAGVNWICLGIESANEQVRNDVNKRIRKDVSQVIAEIRSQGIYTLGNFMFGLPEDSSETMEETLKAAMALDCEFVNFYTVMAYPGSLLFQRLSGKNDLLPAGWEGFSQHGYETKPLPTKYLTSEEVLGFRDEAFLRYFTNQKYIDSMEKKFGRKVKEHLQKMLSIKIKRRILEK